jgi:hypothetical protein
MLRKGRLPGPGAFGWAGFGSKRLPDVLERGLGLLAGFLALVGKFDCGSAAASDGVRLPVHRPDDSRAIVAHRRDASHPSIPVNVRSPCP